jgi:metal-responsive CopG/Arc/MetJ family transcriptional regulator
MKTAVSIPDEIFEGAERLARRTKKSRSRLFSDAVREYLARHAPEEVTAAMDRVCEELAGSAGNNDLKDGFVAAAARRTLKRSEW